MCIVCTFLTTLTIRLERERVRSEFAKQIRVIVTTNIVTVVLQREVKFKPLSLFAEKCKEIGRAVCEVCVRDISTITYYTFLYRGYE